MEWKHLKEDKYTRGSCCAPAPGVTGHRAPRASFPHRSGCTIPAEHRQCTHPWYHSQGPDLQFPPGTGCKHNLTNFIYPRPGWTYPRVLPKGRRWHPVPQVPEWPHNRDTGMLDDGDRVVQGLRGHQRCEEGSRGPRQFWDAQGCCDSGASIPPVAL